MAIVSTNDIIKSPKSTTFRRLFMKRRVLSTGLFEADWQDITVDVKKWGKVKRSVDSMRLNKFYFGNMKIRLANDTGKYNSQDEQSSLWFGYANQQRTLIKVEAGLLQQTLSASGVWQTFEHPQSSQWDEILADDRWDQGTWDSPSTVSYIGIVSGDQEISDNNEITLNIRPLNQVFRDISARNITGYDDSMTASKFMGLLRDQTDSSGNFLVRPFFDNDITKFLISTTTIIYPQIDTGTANEVREKNCWDCIEKFAEAENYISYVNKSGDFIFKAKSDITATVAYEFHGVGSGNVPFGATIKKIDSYSQKVSKLYTRVELQHHPTDSLTSFSVAQSRMIVSNGNASWNFGERTLKIDNSWVATATADSLATAIFNEVSTLRKEISFTTSFVPQVDIFDRVSITYDSGNFSQDSLWDIRNWGDDTLPIASTELVWDASTGDALYLNAKEFILISVEMDLDNFESRFTARES